MYLNSAFSLRARAAQGGCLGGCPLRQSSVQRPAPSPARPRRQAAVSSTAEGQLGTVQPNVEPPAGSAQPLNAEFCSMLDRLRDWRERYYDCIVPRKVHDAGELGEWVHRQRSMRRRGQLSDAAVASLDALGFSWEVDVVTAKWYHNLHAARHYREVHGSGDIPPDLQDPSHPDWVEAGRWLERQRDLYHRQKLLLLRVRLIKEALGVKLVREHSRPRRNLHPVLKAGNADFRAQQRQRQGGEAGEQQEQGKRAQRRPQRRRQLQPRQQQQQQQPPQAAEEP